MPTSTTVAVDDHHPRIVELARRADAARGVVGDQPPDAVDDDRAHRPARPDGADRRSPARRRRRSADGHRRGRRCSPPTTTSRTSPAEAANTTAASGSARGQRRRGAARRTTTVTKSASAPTPSGRRRTIRGSRSPTPSRPSAGQRAVRSPPQRGQPLVELDRPRLLERIDHGVRVRAEAQLDAGIARAPQSGRSRRRDRAPSSGRCSSATGTSASSSMSSLADVRRVHGGEAVAQRAGVVEHADRRDAVRGEALVVLLRLLRHVGVETARRGPPPTPATTPDRLRRRRRAPSGSPHRCGRSPWPRRRARRRARPSFGGPVAEPRLHRARARRRCRR